MKTPSLRARALACALLTGTALGGLAAPASAQTSPIFPNLDSNGVDLVRGDFLTSFLEGSIGSGEAELMLLRMVGAIGSNGSPGASQWDNILLNDVASNGTFVDFGSRHDKFPGAESRGATLTGGGTAFQYHAPDGTVIAFTNPTTGPVQITNFCDGSGTQASCILVPTSITSPDGKVVTFQYAFWKQCQQRQSIEDPINCVFTPRVSRVSNSYGYSIAFSYAAAAGSGPSQPPAGFHERTAATFRNTQAGTDALASVGYSYPSAGVTEITDQGGRVWRVTSASGGYAIRRPGASSDTTSATLSGGVVASVTRDGVTTQYARSVAGTEVEMIVTQVVPGGTSPVTKVVSDLSSGLPTSVVDPLNHRTRFTYDGSLRLERVTAHQGDYVEYEYDDRGNVTKTTAAPKSGTGPTIVTSASFDPTCANPVTCNRPNSTTNSRGNVTVYEYDAMHGGVTKITRPAPSVNAVPPETRFSYTAPHGEHRLTGVSQCRTANVCTGTADEVKTAFAYDSNGNLYWTATGDGTGALRAETTMTFDAVGSLRAVDGPLPTDADTSRTDYDGARRPTISVSADPDGDGPLKPRAVRRTYNGSTGLLEKVEQGHVDGLSDPTWSTFSAAQAVVTDFDSNARPIVSKLVSGSTVHALSQTRYDALGRPDCSVQRMNKAEFGNPLPDACAQTPAAGPDGPDRISALTYDLAGRVTRVRTAIGTGDEADETVISYTPNGQVESVTDGEGNKTSYDYDGHDRLVRTFYPMPNPRGAGTSNGADYEQLTYENIAGGTRTSNLVVAFRNRGNQTAAFGYDALGRRVSKNLPGSEPDVTYGYDLLGRLTSASRTGYALGFTYDALGRVLEQTGPLGTLTSEYDIAGRRTKLTWPDAFYVTYDYLVTGETTAIRENGAASGIGVLATLAYDNLGRRTSLTLGNGVATTYANDPVSRLGELKLELPGTTDDLTSTFEYNPASQITKNLRTNNAYSWTGHGSGTTTATSNGVPESANGLNQVGSWISSLGYDAKGNLTTDGTYTYAYSSENLLTSLANSAPGALQPNIAFSYDPLMRLSAIDSTNSAFDVEFGYDGQSMVLESLSAGRTRRYVHGPGTDEPLVGYLVTPGAGTSRLWYQADERGSIAHLSNDGGVGGIGKYDEYGAGGNGRFRYTGQYWLGEANLLYYRARVYDARLGRFLQPDPIGYGDGMNMYAYVGGDPVNFADPSGLCKNAEGETVSAPTGSRICAGHGAASLWGGIAGSVSGSTTAGPGGAGGPTFGEAYAAAMDAVGDYGSATIMAAADYLMGRGRLDQVAATLSYVPGTAGTVVATGTSITITASSHGHWNEDTFEARTDFSQLQRSPGVTLAAAPANDNWSPGANTCYVAKDICVANSNSLRYDRREQIKRVHQCRIAAGYCEGQVNRQTSGFIWYPDGTLVFVINGKATIIKRGPRL